MPVCMHGSVNILRKTGHKRLHWSWDAVVKCGPWIMGLLDVTTRTFGELLSLMGF